MQNEDKASRVEDDPMPNAKRSVTDVIVMATPACFIVQPNRSLMSLVWQGVFNYTVNNYGYADTYSPSISGPMLYMLWTMTNMSSIPMPSNKKGRMVCMGV